ncbi:MAG: carotenoid oxygenase family protein [Bradymonadia bacterium]
MAGDEINRRRFLVYGAGALSALGLVGCDDDSAGAEASGGAGGMGGETSGGAGGAGGMGGEVASPPLADTGPALADRIPHNITFASRDELDLTLNLISGHLPEGLSGHAFVVAPVPYDDVRATKLNGDGMLYRFDLSPEGVKLKSALLKTPCYYADEATAGTAHAFRNSAITRSSPALGFRNQLNTALVNMDDRLLATFDAGRPWEVDPVSLQLVGPVGAIPEWRESVPVLDGVFPLFTSTAHPVYDHHTKELLLVNYGYGAGGQYSDVMIWRGEGAVHSWTLVDDAGEQLALDQLPHQLALTENHLIVVEAAFLVETEQVFNPDAPGRPQKPFCRLLIVPRSALVEGVEQVTAVVAELPMEAAHLTADYHEPDGNIVLHVGHIPGTDPSEWLRTDDVLAHGGDPIREDLVGWLVASSDIGTLGRHVVDPTTGAVVDHTLTQDDEWSWGLSLLTHNNFPGLPPEGRHQDIFWVAGGLTAEALSARVLDLYAEHPHRTIPVADLPLEEGRPANLLRLDVETMAIADTYAMPAGRAPMSPQFVPKSGSSDPREGFLLCMMSSDDDQTEGSSGQELWIFDAQNLSQGPLARLGHTDINVAFTLHTTWLPTLKAASRTDHPVARDEYMPRIEAIEDDAERAEILALFEASVFPHFEG